MQDIISCVLLRVPPSGGTLSVTHRRTYPLNPSPPQRAGNFFFRGTGLPTAVRKNQPLVPRSNFGGKVCARTDPWFRGQTLPVPGHGGGGGIRTAGTRGGGGGQGTWASQKHSETGYGRPVDRGVWTAKTVKRPPPTTSTSSIRQLLGAADAQTAHHCHIQHSPNTPSTGLRECGNDTSRSTGRSGRQNAATRRNMRREDRVTVQGPVKEQQPDGTSHGGTPPPWTQIS